MKKWKRRNLEISKKMQEKFKRKNNGRVGENL